MRDRDFTYGDLQDGSPFYDLITNGSEFDFDMDDIVRFREEFKTLIEKLSGVFCDWKAGGDNKIKALPASLLPAEKKSNDEEKENVALEPNTAVDDDDDDDDDDDNNNSNNNSSSAEEKKPAARAVVDQPLQEQHEKKEQPVESSSSESVDNTSWATQPIDGDDCDTDVI